MYENHKWNSITLLTKFKISPQLKTSRLGTSNSHITCFGLFQSLLEINGISTSSLTQWTDKWDLIFLHNFSISCMKLVLITNKYLLVQFFFARQQMLRPQHAPPSSSLLQYRCLLSLSQFNFSYEISHVGYSVVVNCHEFWNSLKTEAATRGVL